MMNGIDLDLFDSCAFMLSPEVEWLGENQIFSNNNFLKNAKKKIIQHFEKIKQNITPNECLMIGSNCLKFSLLKMANKNFIVLCVVEHDASITKNFEYSQFRCDNPAGDDSRYQEITSDGVLVVNSLGNIDFIGGGVKYLFPYLHFYNYIGKSFFSLIQDIVSYEVVGRDNYRIMKWFRYKCATNKKICLSFKTKSGLYFEYRDFFLDDRTRFGLIIDESKRYEKEKVLIEKCSELEQLNSFQSDFIATLGHEIRTPLNAVLGLIELSLGNVRAQDKKLLSVAFSTSKQVLLLINSMLDFKKTNESSADVKNDSVDVRLLGESVVDAFSLQADKKDINLDFFMPLNFNRRVICDEVKLNQVIYNLISNSIKFSNKIDSSILLEVEVLEQSFENVKLKFSVIDNGIGLTEEEQSKVFGKYEQASSNSYRQYGGVGLGLYISKSICCSMGSDLQVISRIGDGSVFYFVIDFALDNHFTAHDVSGSYRSDIDASVTAYTNSSIFHESVSRYSKELDFELLYLPSNELLEFETESSILFIDLNQNDIISKNEFVTSLFTRKERVAELRRVSLSKSNSDYEVISYPPLRIQSVTDFVNVKNYLNIIDEQASDSADYSNISVLVIDDCQENLFVIEKQLLSVGVIVSCVQDPMQAIELFKTNKFNVVISDVIMPTISGSDLIGVIREVEGYRELAPSIIVMLTADHGDICKDECLQAGANRVLVKPLTLNDLIGLLDEVKVTLSNNTSLKKSTVKADNTSFDNSFFCCDETPQELVDILQIVNLSDIYNFVGEDISDEELSIFLEQYYSNLLVKREALRSAIVDNDLRIITAISHTLKSNSLYIGAKKLNLSCQELERVSRNNAIDYKVILKCWQEVDDDLFALIEFFMQRSNASG
ncbi:hybrid sensor histidine kinase/response regulator [Shewanella sp. ISTPL2]|uniref:hybrid sensor histidine kinase/response regulator n=1 Tax=Shewanella sp. ISTPL2 TaxID=2699425 RepID=UPI0015688E71|nr:ATP-binding protein [Shewanella sp. ISTPL2]